MMLASNWQLEGPVKNHAIPDKEDIKNCEALIFAEARLADDLKLEQWLDCYSRECIYWIPSSYTKSDPREEITLELHDRRRLEDRVARIRTGLAYSMVPVIRTRHVLGNIEYWQGDKSEIRARASFILDALFDGKHRILSGWCGYSLLNEKNNWKIEVKQTNLIDADSLQENNTFFL